MIVEMSRVLVLGPKRLLGQVIGEVQRLGTLHVDRIESEEAPEVTALQLGEEDAKILQALERALARIDGLLALLPPGSTEPGEAPVHAAVTALAGVVVAFLRRDGERVRAILSRAGATELRLPARFAGEDATETIAVMERRKAEIPAEIERIDRELSAIVASARPRLLAIRAWLADRLAQMKVIPELAQSRYTFILYGWAPTRAVSEVRGVLRSRFGSDIVVHGEPVDAHDEPERIPVLLDNHPLIRPFQRLLALFQPPRYDAWDPSPVMAITFPIFVGLVIGDIGYGLLLLLLGWWLRGRAKAGRTITIPLVNIRVPPPLAADASFWMRVIAMWVVVFGVIYAEFFGNLPELIFHVHPMFNRVERSGEYFVYIIG